MEYIHVMTIAGSDCSGGAGIQADIKTISALGGYASSVITAVTVQNTCGVTAVHPVPAEIVSAQIRAVLTDMTPDAIKIGMVTDGEIIAAICRELQTGALHIPVIFDPVLVSSSGFPLVTDKAMELIRTDLMPLCYLLTPNLPEAQLLSGVTITDECSLHTAAQALLAAGCRNVLIKGGHRTDGQMTDVLFSQQDNDVVRFTEKQIETRNTHGTGCTLSSAIATYVAQRIPLPEAVSHAKQFLTEALKAGATVSLGKGHGPLNHFFDPRKTILK